VFVYTQAVVDATALASSALTTNDWSMK